MKNIKEWFRKRMVTLKRKPHNIPLTMLVVSCLALNLKLTSYSDTIAQVNEPGMGVCLFVIVLCSYLSIISFMTAFPHRKKPKIMSIILVCLMLLISIGGQFIFDYFIRYGTELKTNPIKITPAKAYILVAKQTCGVHIILLSFTLFLIMTMPLYTRFLKKVNTAIEVEEVKIDKIDLAE
jgi:hypothetical protein